MTIEQARAESIERQKEIEVEKQSNDFNHSNDQITVELLETLKLAGVNWADLDVQWVLNEIAARLQALDPKVTIKFLCRAPSHLAQVDVLGRRIDRHVSFATNEKTPLITLLMAVSEQTNLSFRVEKNEVIFMQWQPGNFISLPLLDQPE